MSDRNVEFADAEIKRLREELEAVRRERGIPLTPRVEAARLRAELDAVKRERDEDRRKAIIEGENEADNNHTDPQERSAAIYEQKLMSGEAVLAPGGTRALFTREQVLPLWHALDGAYANIRRWKQLILIDQCGVDWVQQGRDHARAIELLDAPKPGNKPEAGE